MWLWWNTKLGWLNLPWDIEHFLYEYKTFSWKRFFWLELLGTINSNCTSVNSCDRTLNLTCLNNTCKCDATAFWNGVYCGNKLNCYFKQGTRLAFFYIRKKRYFCTTIVAQATHRVILLNHYTALLREIRLVYVFALVSIIGMVLFACRRKVLTAHAVILHNVA